MALPVTISSGRFAQRNSRHGPFLSSAGAVYAIVRRGADTSQLEAHKAVDPTDAFDEVDNGGRPNVTNAIGALWVEQVSDVLHIAAQENTTGRVSYHTFDMASDQWVITDETVETPSAVPVGGMACSLAVRSDGDVLIAYQGAPETVSSSDRDRIVYARRESGVWTTGIALTATGVTSQFRGVTLVLGSSDRVHAHYHLRGSTDAYAITIRSDNTLSAAELYNTGSGATDNIHGVGAAYPRDGATKVRVPWYSSAGKVSIVQYDSADTPTITETVDISTATASVTSGATLWASLAYDALSEVLFAVWIDDASADLFADSLFGAGGWGTDAELRDAVTAERLNASVIIRAGIPRLAILYDTGSAVVYDEVDVGLPLRGAAAVLPPSAAQVHSAAGTTAGAAAVGASIEVVASVIAGASEVSADASVQSPGVQYVWEADSERDGMYDAPIDNLSPYVLGARWKIGMTGESAGAYDEVAAPARMTVQLDNKNGEFFPDTLGAELLTNSDFSAWTSDDPDGWTVTGESGSDPEVSEVGASETHGGTGTGAANLYSSLSANLTLAQNVLTVNQRYQLTLVISARAAGAVRLYSGGVALSPLLQTPDTYVYTFTARATDVTLQTYGATDVTLDSASVKATARYAGVFEIGTLVRARAFLQGAIYPLFVGKVSSFDFIPGVYGEKIAEVTVEDQMWQLLDADFLPELETDVTTDTALRQPFERGVVVYPYRENYWCLDAVGSSELDDTTVLFGDSEAETALAFDTGYTSIEYVGDNLERQLNTSVQGFIRDVTAAEAGGRFYFDALAGKYTFHNRGHDALNLTPDATLTNDDFESASYTRGKDIINAVTINYEPRVAGTAGEVLWTAGDVPFLVEGYSQRRITFRYQDPDDASARIGGMDFINPVADVDYSANDASDGSDDNRKRSCVVTVFFGAAGADMTISNVAAKPFYITLLRVRGTPLRAYERRQVEATAATSMARYERREKVLDIASMNDPAFAQSYADFLVNRFAQPLTRLARARFVADKTDTRRLNALTLGIGSRIAFTDAQTGHSGDYLIVGAEHAFTPGGSETPYAGTHDVLWILAPASRTQYWRLSDGVDFTDVSVLDETTRLML